VVLKQVAECCALYYANRPVRHFHCRWELFPTWRLVKFLRGDWCRGQRHLCIVYRITAKFQSEKIHGVGEFFFICCCWWWWCFKRFHEGAVERLFPVIFQMIFYKWFFCQRRQSCRRLWGNELLKLSKSSPSIPHQRTEVSFRLSSKYERCVLKINPTVVV